MDQTYRLDEVMEIRKTFRMLVGKPLVSPISEGNINTDIRFMVFTATKIWILERKVV